MVKNGIISGSKKQSYILRKLLRRVLYSQYLNEFDLDFININNFSLLSIQLSLEITLLKRSKKAIKKFLSKKDNLSGEDILFLKESLGCYIDWLKKQNKLNCNWDQYYYVINIKEDKKI